MYIYIYRMGVCRLCIYSDANAKHYGHIYTHLHTRTLAHSLTWIHTHTCVRTHTHTLEYARSHTHTHTANTNTHIHTHTHTSPAIGQGRARKGHAAILLLPWSQYTDTYTHFRAIVAILDGVDACIHTYTHSHAHAHIHTHAHAHAHIHTHTHHTHTHTHTHTRPRAHTHTHTKMHKHTCWHTHVRTCTRGVITHTNGRRPDYDNEFSSASQLSFGLQKRGKQIPPEFFSPLPPPFYSADRDFLTRFGVSAGISRQMPRLKGFFFPKSFLKHNSRLAVCVIFCRTFSQPNFEPASQCRILSIGFGVQSSRSFNVWGAEFSISAPQLLNSKTPINRKIITPNSKLLNPDQLPLLS